jgi:homoserine dehydrogenase
MVRVGFLGYGRVGQAVAAVAGQRRSRLLAANLDLRCVDAFVRDPRKQRPGPHVRLSTDASNVVGSGVDVIVEVLGGLDPARRLVEAALDAGIPVVSANKTLVAAAGAELRGLASRRRTAFAFDAAVLAGVPFLGSLSRRPLIAEASEIAGVLNGTSNFILSEMAQGASFEKALTAAISRGYAEPDSRADISGLDAAQKLSVLLQLAGCAAVPPADVPSAALTILHPRDLTTARRLGGAIKPIAFASLRGSGSAWAGPAFVPDDDPLSRINGVENGLRITGVNGHAVTFAGPGAGPEVTAVTILDDIVEIFTGGLSSSSAHTDRPDRSELRFDEPPDGGWFVRTGGGIDLQPAQVAEFFAARGVPFLHLVSERGDLVGLSAPAAWPAVQEAVAALRAIGAQAIAIPVIGGQRE